MKKNLTHLAVRVGIALLANATYVAAAVAELLVATVCQTVGLSTLAAVVCALGAAVYVVLGFSILPLRRPLADQCAEMADRMADQAGWELLDDPAHLWAASLADRLIPRGTEVPADHDLAFAAYALALGDSAFADRLVGSSPSPQDTALQILRRL